MLFPTFRLELALEFRFDVVQENADVRVSVKPHVLVVEAQNVGKFVYNNTEAVAPCTIRDSIFETNTKHGKKIKLPLFSIASPKRLGASLVSGSVLESLFGNDWLRRNRVSRDQQTSSYVHSCGDLCPTLAQRDDLFSSDATNATVAAVLGRQQHEISLVGFWNEAYAFGPRLDVVHSFANELLAPLQALINGVGHNAFGPSPWAR